MKKVLFFPKLEPHKDFHHLPLSILAAAAPMVAKGEDIEIIDQRIEGWRDKLIKALFDASDFMVSSYTGYQLSMAQQVSGFVKMSFPKAKITWGGPHASSLPQQTLASPVVDEVVCGDVDDGSHPLPYHLINVGDYVNPATERAIFLSSYNCVGSCTFCQTHPRRKLLFLPYERIEADISNLMDLHKFRQAVFFDATLTTKPERALFVSRLMRQHGLTWICDARADEICRMPEGMLEEIAESGLIQITIGLESGSPRIIEMMKKGRNHLEKFRRAAKILSRYPVRMVSGTIFGTPSETPEDLRMTLNYIREIRDINPNFFVSSTFYKPLPGTLMNEMAKQYGYREPQSLETWARQGAEGHYLYNTWQAAPWIMEAGRYREIYEDFCNQNKELFV